MLATKAWAEALRVPSCRWNDSSHSVPSWLLDILGLENLMPPLAPPDEASANTDERAKTEKLYFNAPNVDSFDIKTYETRTSETVGTN